MDTKPENKKLKSIITDIIREKGQITFSEYMDMALYHSVEGYYNSFREKIGKDGDYYTSSHVHPVFGQLIARQIHQMWNVLGKNADFTVMEAGAGKGFLCCDILDYIKDQFPRFYESLTYGILEVSSHFALSQRELLEKHDHRDKVTWYTPDDFKKREFSFNGCYLSNELLDAFPVNIVRMEEDGLKEIYVTLRDDVFVEELGDLSTPALEQYFKNLDVQLDKGQRAEVNLNMLDWLKEINIAMGRGFVITIDYGYTAEELFAPYRRNGTLSCYYRHTVNHNPYTRLGYQDITAHVDFTTLMKTGEEIGLENIHYLEQYRFLMALGLLDIMADLEKKIYMMSTVEYYREKLAMKNFLIPGGMGVLFKVLLQQKGLEPFHVLNLFTS